MLNVDTVLNWPFSVEKRCYSHEDCMRYAKGFGVGLAGELLHSDQAFLNKQPPLVLPMVAVPLADGEFWPQDPKTGIVWQKMLHAAESITVHQPLPVSGEVTLTQKVDKIFDRGAERGAVMHQQQYLHAGDTKLITIDVTTILMGNGGFGGDTDTSPREKVIPDDRPADAVVEVKTPTLDNTLFQLNADLDVAGNVASDQRALRGVCSFGLLGRAALHLLCANQPQRLQYLGVRYAGVMLTDETMKVEMWHLEAGKAALRMSSVERDKPVLNHCVVEFDCA